MTFTVHSLDGADLVDPVADLSSGVSTWAENDALTVHVGTGEDSILLA